MHGTLDAPIGSQEFQELRWQQSLRVFASLALPHPEHIPASVDVRRLELCHLRDAEPAAIQGGQHSTIAKLAGASKSALTSSRLRMSGSVRSRRGNGMR